jgi:photosystem II stability/assembly factor-like uncharacterized protein
MRLVLSLAMLVVFGTAAAGVDVWTSLGPDGGLIRQVIVAPSAPDTLYAVGHGGAWKSTDAGAHWSPARTGITELTLQTIAVDPTNAQIVYAGSILGGGVFKSTDGGATWTSINTGISITTIKSLAVDPVNPANVYAGTDCCGIYKSANAGGTWTLLQTGGLPGTSISSIVIDPTAPSTVYAGTQSQGVYKSTNGGTTWVAANAGLASSNGAFNTLNRLAIDPAASGTLYAATNGAIFKSVNGGQSWAPSNGTLVNPSVLSVVVSAQAPSTLYIGTLGGVRRSVDGGATWTVANSGATSNMNTLAIDPANPSRVYGGTAVGVFVTSNGAATWSLSNTGLANSTVQALVVDYAAPTTVYAGTAGAGVMKTTDGGATWNASNSGMTTGNGGFDIRALAIDPANPATLYAGSGAGIFKSVNGGASWASIEHGSLIRNISSIAIDPLMPTTIRVGTFFTGIFVSTNGGDTWTTENQGIPPPTSVNALAAGNPQVVASTPSAGTFMHDTSSATWLSVPGLPPNVELASLDAVHIAPIPTAGPSPRNGIDTETTIGGVRAYYPEHIALLWLMSFKRGINVDFSLFNVWQPLPLAAGVDPATCPPIKAIAGPQTPGTFYAGGACGVLAVSASGDSVTRMNTGFPAGLQVSALAMTPTGTDIYAGTEGGGVFRYTKSGAATPVTVVEYYNATLDHYFITWVAAEQANLDAGNTPTRWTRTGLSFKTTRRRRPGASPVCRYYIPPAKGDSHFFGRGTQECNATGQANPTFILESPDFMFMFLPLAGTCPASTTPVYRVFSNRPDANHRYMTDRAVRDQMAAKGWLVEGDGPDAVVMCAPQ